MKTLKKVFYYITPYWGKAIASVTFNLLGTLFSLFSFTMAIPFLGILFDQQKIVSEPVAFELSAKAIQHNFNYFLSQIILDNGPQAALMTVSFMVVGLTLLKSASNYSGNYLLAPLRNGVVRDIRNAMYQKILRLHMGYFSEERKGDLIARITGDIQEIEASVIRSLDKAIKSPLQVIIYMTSLFIMSYQLTLFVLILLPVSGYVISRVGKSLRKKSAKGQKKMGLLLGIIEETLFGMRIINAFNAQPRVFERFNDQNQRYFRIMNKLWRKKYLAHPLSELLATMVIVVVMWYGGSMVLNESTNMSPQAFITYLIIFSQIIPPSKNLSSVYYNMQKGFASFDRVDEVLNAEEKIVSPPDALPISAFKDSIQYQQVHFAYGNEWVLQDINLEIKKGQTVALVGQSGAGKSTLADLLPRFYDVQQGQVQVDGHSVSAYDLRDLRDLMGIVTQEQILFNDTIYNNIAFGVASATEEEIIQAAKVANAHDFIVETSEGYQTNIGDRGTKLSGGQRQRLTIARAVLKNPPILILDEATSALDTESERLVQDALDKLMKNRTSIVIAHRLSTIKNADLIGVLQDGRLIELGRHDELLQHNTAFKQFYENQFE